MALIALAIGSGCGSDDSAAEVQDDACANVNCGHGVCAVSTSRATVCACEKGYYAEGLSCVSNACSGIDCGPGGSCAAAETGAPVCTCGAGYRSGGPTTCLLTGSGSDGGVEGTSPNILVPPSSMPSQDTRLGGVAVDATHIYWGENVRGSVAPTGPYHAHRIPLAGGPVEDLGEQGGPSTAVVVDDTDLFFCRLDGVYALPKTGGTLRLVSAATNGCRRRGGSGAEVVSFARAGDKVYWLEESKTLRRAPSAGGPAEIVATASGVGGVFFSFTIAGPQLFAAEYQHVLSMGLDGAGSTSILDGTTSYDNVFVAGDQLLFSESNAVIRSMPVGGGPSSIVSYTPSGIGHFAVDGAGMWIADSQNGPKLYHMAGPGQLPTYVTSNPGGPSSNLLLAPGFVVWASETAILTVPR